MPLTIKLDTHQFTLSNETLIAMAQSLAKTRVKERGFMLCQSREQRETAEITPGREHIGGPGAISVRNCGGKDHVGHFHSHPGTDSVPSWHDAYSILWNSTYSRPWLGCRAGTNDKTIRCDTLKKLPTNGEMGYLKRKRTRMRFTDAQKDPDIWQYMGLSYSLDSSRIRDVIKEQLGVKVPDMGFPAAVVACDRNHSLSELRAMAKQAGLSTSGDKKELCRKLMAAGVKV